MCAEAMTRTTALLAVANFFAAVFASITGRDAGNPNHLIELSAGAVLVGHGAALPKLRRMRSAFNRTRAIVLRVRLSAYDDLDVARATASSLGTAFRERTWPSARASGRTAPWRAVRPPSIGAAPPWLASRR